MTVPSVSTREETWSTLHLKIPMHPHFKAQVQEVIGDEKAVGVAFMEFLVERLNAHRRSKQVA